MGKISSLYTAGKSYIKSFFYKSAKKAEPAVAEKAEQAGEEHARVTSKQIEAYYKKYEKTCVKRQDNQKTSEGLRKSVKVDEKLEREINAYNQARFVDVSEDALKSLEENFDEKRAKVIEIISANSEFLSPEYLSLVKNIKTTSDLAYVLRSYLLQYLKGLNAKYMYTALMTMRGKNLSLESQQQMVAESAKINEMIVKIMKAVVNPSKDPKVQCVEKYLQMVHGMDFVHLESMEEARRILETIDIVKKYNVPMPKNLIITPFTMMYTSGENIAHNFSERTILIQSMKERTHNINKAYNQFSDCYSGFVKELKESDKTYFSTENPLHVYVHEFMHSTQSLEYLLPYACKPLPKKIIQAAKSVSGYAVTSRADLDVEVKTKNALSSLNKDEKEILEYFE